MLTKFVFFVCVGSDLGTFCYIIDTALSSNYSSLFSKFSKLYINGLLK